MVYEYRDGSPWEHRKGLWGRAPAKNGQNWSKQGTKRASGFVSLGLGVLAIGLWKGLARGLCRLVVPVEIPVRLVEGSAAAEEKQSRRRFSSETEVGIDGTSKVITQRWCLVRVEFLRGTPPETGLWTCPTRRFRNDVWIVFRFLHRTMPLGSLSPAHVAVRSPDRYLQNYPQSFPSSWGSLSSLRSPCTDLPYKRNLFKPRLTLDWNSV